MSVRVLGRTLICVAGWLMLEEADDLQIGRLHIRAVHFDGDLDAQRLSRKNIFLRRWRVGCACGRNQTRQREAQRKTFSVHNWSSFYGVSGGFLGHNLRFLSRLRRVMNPS